MFTPTPTTFFYEPQKIEGQEEAGLIVMACLAAMGLLYFGGKLLFGKRHENEDE